MEGFTAAKPNTSRWEMKRPACLAAASFLGTTTLFIPLYQGWMLPQQSPGKRIFCLGMLLLAPLAAALAAQFGCKREVWRCRIVLVLLSSGTAVLVVFGSLERVLPAVRAADGQQAALQVEVLACDVMDYGSRYLVRTVGQGALPSGLKGRVYSFEEPAADEGDRMELTARLQTEIENDDRSRTIFFYAFTEEGTLRRTQKHQTVRGRMLAAADSLYDAPVLGMVEGVLFGEREEIDRHFAQMLEDAGLVHILSVSGIHISLLASFCNGVFSRGEDNLRRFTGLLALLPVWSYIALAQFAPSAVRAGLMATLSAVGLLLHRERDALSALAVSAVAIVAFSPFSLYSVSFQLSFWVTLGILLCTSPLTQMLEQLRPVAFLLGRAGKLSWQLRGVCATVAASIAATVFSLPLMLFYFQSAAVWSVLSSVLALWAVSPLMILSMLSILLKLLFDAAGLTILLLAAKTLAGVAGLFARWILLCSRAVALLPGALFFADGLPAVLCGFVLVALLVLAVRGFGRLTVLQRRRRGVCLLACSALCLSTVQLGSLLSAQGVLHIFATDNALVLTRDGQGAVIGNIASDYEAGQIETILRCQRVRSLEALCCTAEDTGDSQGIDLLLQAFPAKVVAAPQQGSFSAHIRRAVGEQEVLDPKGIQLELLGGVTLRQTADGVEILAGEKKLLKTGQNYAIIKQEACDAVLSPNGIWLREGPGMGVFDTLQQNPVLKIEWQATSV